MVVAVRRLGGFLAEMASDVAILSVLLYRSVAYRKSDLEREPAGRNFSCFGAISFATCPFKWISPPSNIHREIDQYRPFLVESTVTHLAPCGGRAGEFPISHVVGFSSIPAMRRYRRLRRPAYPSTIESSY